MCMLDSHRRGLVAVHRLKTRPQFQATLAGATVARTAHFALHRLLLSASAGTPQAMSDTAGPVPDAAQALFALDGVWVGAMVPKRWARRAVTRNTIKRQIYAVSSRFADRLPSAAHVVRLRCAFDRKQFISATSEQLKKAVREELEQLFQHGVRA
jgi:ribonuclease P protein component